MLAFASPASTVRPALPDEAITIGYLRHAALWCLDMPERSPATIAAFLDRIPDVDAGLIEEGRYFVADSGREILGGAGWSPLGAEVRAWLFGEHLPARRPDTGSDAVLVRGFFVQERGRVKVALSLLDAVEAHAARAGFRSAEIVIPAVLQGNFLAMGFEPTCRLQFAAAYETVPLVHMRKIFSSALSDAA